MCATAPSTHWSTAQTTYTTSRMSIPPARKVRTSISVYVCTYEYVCMYACMWSCIVSVCMYVYDRPGGSPDQCGGERLRANHLHRSRRAAPERN